MRSNYSAWMQLFTFFKVNDRSLMPIEHSTIGVALCEKLTPSELFSLMAQNKNGYDISKSLGLSFDLFWIWSWAKLRLVLGNSVSQFLRWIPFPEILLILSHNPRQHITTAFSLKTSDFFATKGAYLASSMESGSLCPRLSGTKQDKKLASNPAPPKR